MNLTDKEEETAPKGFLYQNQFVKYGESLKQVAQIVGLGLCCICNQLAPSMMHVQVRQLEKAAENGQKATTTHTPQTKASALLPELAVFQGNATTVSGHQTKCLQSLTEPFHKPHHRLPASRCNASCYL